jgi:hypothetical protein
MQIPVWQKYLRAGGSAMNRSLVASPGKESSVLRPMLLFAALSACWAILLGKDMNWDLFNYHLYAPHALLHYELPSDFLGSGWVRYLNPLPHLPFYLMVVSDWPAPLIGAINAILHSLNVFFLWLICRSILFHDRADARDWVALATFLGCLTTVFLGLVGSTFSDPLVSPMVLAAIWVLLRPAADLRSRGRYVGAGILLGLATGLKLTNVVFLMAAALATLALPMSFKQRLVAATTLLLATMVGALVSNGWWAIQLQREFQSPFFPLLNQYFQSPDFPTGAIRHERFLPTSVMDLFTLPFRALQHRSWVYYENVAPDWRMLALISSAMLLVLTRIARRFRSAASDSMSAQVPLLIFFSASYFLWQITSGNARYALPWLLLLGPVTVYIIAHAVSYAGWAKSIVIILTVVQLYVIAVAGNPRWGPSDWTREWLAYDVPTKLRKQPFGFVSIELNSSSSLAPFVHEQSRFTNTIGMHVVDPNGPGSARIHEFISRHRGNLRSLSLATNVRVDGKHPVNSAFGKLLSIRLAQWNLTPDLDDCVTITVSDGPDTKLASIGHGLVSCALVEGNPLRDQQRAERVKIDPIFSHLERVCPRYFAPKDASSAKTGRMWARYYVNTDTRLYLLKGRFAFSRYDYGPFDVDLGSEEELANGKVPDTCL